MPPNLQDSKLHKKLKFNGFILVRFSVFVFWCFGGKKIVFEVGSTLKNEEMNISDTHNQRIAKMIFALVYPMYLKKVEKKGRTKEELNQVIEWLTGFDEKKLLELIEEKATFEIFFQKATLNPNAHLITGIICGYRVEEIQNQLTQQVRYLDKLVDELAKGRKMEKILRVAQRD